MWALTALMTTLSVTCVGLIGYIEKWKERTMAELKPCPFCGSKAKYGENCYGQFFVWCTNDDCDARIFAKSPEEAAEAWNRRVDT